MCDVCRSKLVLTGPYDVTVHWPVVNPVVDREMPGRLFWVSVSHSTTMSDPTAGVNDDDVAVSVATVLLLLV